VASAPIGVKGYVLFSSTLGVLWPPVFTSLFVGAVLVIPTQAHELYRILIQGDDWIRAVVTLLLLAILSYVTNLMGQALIQTIKPPAITPNTPEGFLARILPGACGALIPFVAGVGAIAAAVEIPHISLPSTAIARSTSLAEIARLTKEALVQAKHLQVAGWGLIGIAVALFVVTFVLNRRRQAPVLAEFVSAHWPGVWIGGAGLYCLLSIVFTVSNRAAASLGTLAVVCIFAVLLVTFLSGLRVGSRRLGLPVITLGFVAGGIFSVLGWNDNHIVRETLLEHPKPIADFAGPQLAFQAWFRARQDLGHYTEKRQPYPVFIVAARGGGIYAAGQVAIFLSRMQDQCPNFSQHIFAISGVSGGSVGAAVFSSLARKMAQNRPWQSCDPGEPGTGGMESHAKSFIETDFLAPIVAAALFPDLLQRFLPFRIGATDRGKALAKGMERAWQASEPGSKNPFEEAFLNQWNPESAAPALLFNTTEVGNGRRLVISPFAIIPSIPAALSQSAWFYETRETFPTGGTRPPPVARDLRLSEAAGISARFPWLLPAAAIERDGKLIRLVDGGYFDNSGIETALNVIEVLTGLRQIHLDHPAEGDGRFDYFDFDIHLITISGSGVDSPDTLQGLSDVLAPIQALFSARNAEGSLAYVRGQTALRSSRDDTHPAATLDEQDMPLALGFQMSGNSIGLIAAEVGEASQCGRFLAPFVQEAARITPDPQWIMEYVRENSYTSCLMKYLLSGENMPTGNAYPEEPQSSPPH
jgi:hypothetical protein